MCSPRSAKRARATQKAKDMTVVADQLDALLAKQGVPVEWGQYQSLAELIRNVRARPICQGWEVG